MNRLRGLERAPYFFVRRLRVRIFRAPDERIPGQRVANGERC